MGETQKDMRNTPARNIEGDGRATKSDSGNGAEVDQPRSSADKHPENDVSSGENRKQGQRRRNRRSRSKNRKRPADAPTTEQTSSKHDEKAEKQQSNSADRNNSSNNRRKRANRNNRVQNQNQQQLYAALDLGTNNCRLLVAKPTKGGQFRVVDAFSRIVRLGEGLTTSGRLSDNAMERAVGALKICASKLARHQIKNYRLIATEACRQASNGEKFLNRVKQETGLDLEIINRETEARLAVSGCASLVERDTKSVVLFDIGGGSSEIAAIHFDEKRTQRLANHIKSWTSLPVGVVTLSERHGGQNVTPEVFDAMVHEVDQLIEKHAPDAMLEFAPSLENFHLLGTSGTVTTLAGLHLELPRYDRRKVDGLWMQDEDVDKMLDQLLSWDLNQRSANPCIGPDRSDLVLAGCAIMQSIRKRWPSNRMRVADRGLREGLLNDMMAKDGVWRRRRKRRPHTKNNTQSNPAKQSHDSQKLAKQEQLDGGSHE